MKSKSLVYVRSSSRKPYWTRAVKQFFLPFYPRRKKDWLFLAYWSAATLVMLGQSAVLAQEAPSGADNGGGSTSCNGWMCGPKNALLKNPAFSENRASLLIDFIFVALNAGIIIAIGYQAYKIFTAMREEEGWQSMGRNLAGEVMMLIATNYLAGWVVGIGVSTAA